MATLWYGHFNSTSADQRKLQSYEWARYINSFITDGIRNGGTCLQVTADTGMRVKLDEGVANIQGYIMRLEADYEGRYYQVLVPEAHNQYPRIDRLVLRLELDPGNGMAGHIKPVVLRGTAASAPVAPPLTRNKNVWELSLAQIRVAANAAAVTQANITDERFNTELCGLINSVLGLDPSAWQAQFDEFIARMLIQEGEFLQTHGGKFETQLGGQMDGYLAQKKVIDGWYQSVKHEIAKLQTFYFDNLAALAEAQKKTVFSGKTITETIINPYSRNKVAERLTSFESSGDITAETTVYDADGVNVMKRAVVTTKFNADGSIDEIVSGYDDYTLNAAFVGGICIDGGISDERANY